MKGSKFIAMELVLKSAKQTTRVTADAAPPSNIILPTALIRLVAFVSGH